MACGFGEPGYGARARGRATRVITITGERRGMTRHPRSRCSRLVAVGLLIALAGGIALPAGAQAAGAVGKAALVRGAVTAHLEGGVARILGAGSEVFAGDVVSTGPRSVGVLEMADGTRMALRPGTVFQVEEYHTEPARESSILRLFRGGLRAITGFISKRNRDAFKVRTATATIGIRGTTFDVRVCEDDCREEEQSQPPVAGRLALARGNVTLANESGVERPVRPGARVREGETIRTGLRAYAILLLQDGSRVSVAQDSAFRVDRMRHRADDPSTGQAILSFLRGGLRILTGAVARNTPERYKIRTPVATIGIRGTGIDLQCQGLCVSPPGGPVDPDNSDGMTAEVWQGTIDFDGQFPLSGGALFFSNIADGPVAVPGVPNAFIVPRPDQITLPPLPPGAGPTLGGGTYVSCYQGECTLRRIGDPVQDEITLGAGDAAVLGDGEGDPALLGEPPAFMTGDPYLGYVRGEIGRILGILDAPPSFAGGLECRI